MENEFNTIALEKLVGYHMLSGVEYIREDPAYMEKIEKLYDLWQTPDTAIRFCLDGITYEAYIDPDDGYRSYLSRLTVSPIKMKNTFPPQPVYIKLRYDASYSERSESLENVPEDYHCTPHEMFDSNSEDVSTYGKFLTLYNIDTAENAENSMILTIGTDTSDSYYPYAIIEYKPENLPINLKKQSNGDKLLS